jgi:hypothetical protein
MAKLMILLLAAAAAFAADDPWAKVRELKGGTELRIYKKGTAQPVLAKSDELTDDNLVVVVKNAQVAIPRDQIDRIDYRPYKSRVTTETKSKTTEPDTTPGPPGHGSTVPGTSTSTNVGIGSKPDFEEIYRRPVGQPNPSSAPKK